MLWRSGRAVPILIEQQSADPSYFWERVEQILGEGQVVGIRSPLLERLTKVLGEEYEGRSWLVLRPQRRHHGDSKLLRFRDVVVSGLSLLLASPLLLLLGMLVICTSPGPIFYSASVTGSEKQLFRWYKLRSMKVLPEEEDQSQRRAQFETYVRRQHESFKSQNNREIKVIDQSRVTPVGKWIRKYSLDEMPQLWNVLRGEMTLVGPRPCLPYEAPFFHGWRERRFTVPAGLTGVWQVFGRGATSFDEAAAMDVYYVFRRSFMFDLHLMVRTFAEVLRGKGAM